MGIHGLGRFLAETVPECIKHQDIQSFLGQVIAIDASMSLYQFVIAIRDVDGYGSLTNDAGEGTSHISGFLSRCTRLLEQGVKPIYVFDGEPCDLKRNELDKRSERRSKAKEQFEAAQEAGRVDEMKKFSGRTVKITAQHNSDVKELLSLIGIPTLDAPSEAEAQCASLAKAGLVYATATEDMDALTFGSPVLIRHLSFSEKKSNNDKPIAVLFLQTILEKLELSMAQFIDFCMLCGCDYCDRLKGIGPHTAYKLIKKHTTLEKVLETLGKTKEELDSYDYSSVRQFFMNPKVLDPNSISPFIWRSPQEDKLRELLTERYNFNEKRVANYLTRYALNLRPSIKSLAEKSTLPCEAFCSLSQAKGRSSQRRLDSFFGVALPKPLSGYAPPTCEKLGVPKRKLGETNEKKKKKKK